MAGQDRADWHDRSHFMGVAAQVMRRILVDYARRRMADKRGGAAVRLDLEGFDLGKDGPKVEEILAVDELDPQQGRVVALRYFAGLSVEETAEALGILARTVKRDWAKAMAWLRCELSVKGAP